ncbi:MAG: radical SAM protein [Thermoleophilia bacterium]|nr:radical SAM protein [Thermoleophilia bacterium]
MRYEGQIYRPPCEARSLVVQATIGCPWNRCTFCGMYKDRKFRVRPLDETLRDLQAARAAYPHVASLFLADGNTIALPTADLLAILERASALFPELDHVGAYGGARYLAGAPADSTRPAGRGLPGTKSVAELATLREAGLSMVYMGLESGDDEVLRRVRKGVTSAQMITAARRLKEAGFPVSLYVLVGLGGSDRSQAHARATAEAINAIEPDIVRPRTLYILEQTPLWHQRRRGDFVEAAPRGALLEIRTLLEGIRVPVALVSDHITNYLPLHGCLPRDRADLIAAIDRTLAAEDLSSLRPQHFDHL